MAKPAYYSLNQNGSSGPDVGLIQKWLNGIRTKWTSIIPLTVDGKFGTNTTNAVKQFQTIAGLTVDGKVGVNTWNALYDNYAAIIAAGEQYPGVYIKNGTRGATVKSAQARLTVKGYPLNPDGIFGSKTLAATKAYQAANGLSADGIIGSKTWTKLYA
jgi:peptidoglycan hydrolase-like protein with peptidoglycan-binding domain